MTDESSTDAEVAFENESMKLNKIDQESNKSNETEDEFMNENI